MRGKVWGQEMQTQTQGITPAYAGKSSGTEWSVRTDRDHPRLCGEKVCRTSKISADAGSPPPMRGKVNRGATPRV